LLRLYYFISLTSFWTEVREVDGQAFTYTYTNGVGYTGYTPYVSPPASSSTGSNSTTNSSSISSVVSSTLLPVASVSDMALDPGYLGALISAGVAFSFSIIGFVVLAIFEWLIWWYLTQKVTKWLTDVVYNAVEENKVSTSAKDIASSSPASPDPDEPNSPRQIKNNKRANDVAEELGYESAETLKKEWLPNENESSYFNMYRDTSDGRIWLRHNNSGQWVPTDLYYNP
jgi:hypothetical protein